MIIEPARPVGTATFAPLRYQFPHGTKESTGARNFLEIIKGKDSSIEIGSPTRGFAAKTFGFFGRVDDRVLGSNLAAGFRA